MAFVIRSVILLKCLIASGYFRCEVNEVCEAAEAAVEDTKNGESKGTPLSSDQLYIGELLFHFQTGIQYNLHAVYQVSKD